MRYESQDFSGLTPAIDARRSERLFALAGRNYVLDALGPKSPFGNRYLTPYPVGVPDHTQGCRLRLRTGDRVFTFLGDCIVEWSESEGGWKFIYVTNDTTAQPYRWTFGYLDGIIYFCHPATGILAYNVTTGICLPLDVPGTPEGAIAITIDNGRLCVLDEIYFSWSAPGNGQDFTPRLGGAGQQKLSERIAGFPIMLASYGGGVLTWTTGGVMRSEFTGDREVYRHRALNTELRPINSFCVWQQDNNSIGMLDERGFFSSKGDIPAPLTPLFNEFLIHYLQDYDIKVGVNARIEWDDLRRLLYLSLSFSQTNPLYEKCFVLYPSIDKWGTFDETHYGILPILIAEQSRADDYFGFVDSTRRVRYWNRVGSREILPSQGGLNSVYPRIQKPAHNDSETGAIVLSSSAVANTVNDIMYTGRSGYYGASGYSPASANLTGLDSVLQMGLIRAKSDIGLDRLLEITESFVGSNISGPQDQVSIDFNLIPPTIPTPEATTVLEGITFDVDTPNYVNHGYRIIGTIDGKTMWQDAEPKLTTFEKSGRFFAGGPVGLWHIVEFTAIEIGEAYHIKALELTAIDAGSYN